MQDIIDRKIRELTTPSAEVARKDVILGLIQEQLETATEPLAKALNETLKLVKSTRLTNDWHKFVLHFNDVHPQFFDKLQARFPNLSDNDLRVCAYIKMKLTNKETAQLLNISSKGLETARYRLEKKTNLNADEDLSIIIRDF